MDTQPVRRITAQNKLVHVNTYSETRERLAILFGSPAASWAFHFRRRLNSSRQSVAPTTSIARDLIITQAIPRAG